MSLSSARPNPEVGLEWVADLTLEHEGDRVATLRSEGGTACTLDIAGRRGLRALSSVRPASSGTPGSPGSSPDLAGLLPERIDLRLSGMPIGQFEPAAPLNWWARKLGLPFGGLTINKLALLRAGLLGER